MANEFRDPGETFVESPRLQAEVLLHAVGADARVLDFIARLADAWNAAPGAVLALSVHERRALCAIGAQPWPGELTRWEDLDGDQRRALIVAARRAVEFGRSCAWIFGEARR